MSVVCIVLFQALPASAAIQLWSEGNGTGPNGVANESYPYDAPNGDGNAGDVGSLTPNNAFHIGTTGRSATDGLDPLGSVLETYTIWGSVQDPVAADFFGEPHDDTDLFNFTVLPGAVFDFSLVQVTEFDAVFATLKDNYDYTGAILDGPNGGGAGISETGIVSTGPYSVFLAATLYARYRVTITITQVAEEPPALVPEPSTSALALLGLLGLGLFTWRKKLHRI
jgi:hypothetical protein